MDNDTIRTGNFLNSVYTLAMRMIVMAATCFFTTTWAANSDKQIDHPLVLQAIFANSLTQSVIQQEYDHEIQQQVIDIEQLSLNIGKGTQTEELKILQITQQILLDTLIQRNPHYAKAITALRQQLNEVISTSLGERALYEFVNGDAERALTMFNDWAQERNTTATGQQKLRWLADQRYIAQLAADAAQQHRLATIEAISRLKLIMANDASVHGDWMLLAQLYSEDGQYDQAIRSAQQGFVTASNNQQAYSALLLQGDVHYQQNQLSQALRAYQSSLRILNKQLQNTAAPQGSNLTMDHFLTLKKLGTIQIERGDLDGALFAYQQALQPIQSILTRYPDSIQKQQLQLDVQEQIAHIHAAQGLTNSALNGYQQCYEMRQKIAAQDASGQSLRDVASTLDHIGDLKKQLGLNKSALAAYRQSYNIRAQLAENSPDSAVSQRDIAVSLTKMAAIKTSGIGWHQVLEQFEAMDSSGQLAPDDREYLTFSREMTALHNEPGD